MRVKVSGIAELRRFARDISRFPEVAADAAADAANEVAVEVMNEAISDIDKRYNLPANYVKDRFKLLRATATLDAVVGARIRWTTLARYEAKQLTVPAPRAKGDPRRGIPAGQKQAGVSFKVLRQGKQWNIRRAFLVPLRAGKLDGGNGMGIFWRDDRDISQIERGLVEEEVNFHRGGWRGKTIKHLYGISVHQAYQYWLQENLPDIQSSFAEAFSKHFQRSLKSRGSKTNLGR